MSGKRSSYQSEINEVCSLRQGVGGGVYARDEGVRGRQSDPLYLTTLSYVISRCPLDQCPIALYGLEEGRWERERERQRERESVCVCV